MRAGTAGCAHRADFRALSRHFAADAPPPFRRRRAERRRPYHMALCLSIQKPRPLWFRDNVVFEIGDAPCSISVTVYRGLASGSAAARCAAARIISAMPDPAAPEVDAALDHQPCHVGGQR